MSENISARALAVGVYELALADYVGLYRFLKDRESAIKEARRFINARYKTSKTPKSAQLRHIRILLLYAKLSFKETREFLCSRNLWSETLGLSPAAFAEKLDKLNLLEFENATQVTFFLIDQWRCAALSDTNAQFTKNFKQTFSTPTRDKPPKPVRRIRKQVEKKAQSVAVKKTKPKIRVIKRAALQK